MRVETWWEFICSIISYQPSQSHFRKCNHFYKIVIRDKICLNFTMTSHCLGAQISDFLSFLEREKILSTNHIIIRFLLSFNTIYLIDSAHWIMTISNKTGQWGLGNPILPMVCLPSLSFWFRWALTQSTAVPRIYWHWRGSGWIWSARPADSTAAGGKLRTLNLVIHCSPCHGSQFSVLSNFPLDVCKRSG